MARKEKMVEPIPADFDDVSSAIIKTENIPLEKKVDYEGVLNIGDIELRCFVSEDGERFISGRSMTAAIGMKGRGQGVARISNSKTLKPYFSNELSVAIESHILLVGKTPKPVHGYRAESLVDLCDTILEARNDGALKTNQENRYGLFAETMVRGFARVGLAALIDEATGYQDYRAKDALAKILEQFLDTELQKWTKTFPDDFYREIFRLRGWAFNPHNVSKRPQIIGKWTNEFVYDRLAPGLLEELKNKNPKDHAGKRLTKHHQWFNTDFGHPRLREHIFGIVTLLKVSRSWGEFKKAVKKAFPKEGEQHHLPIKFDD